MDVRFTAIVLLAVMLLAVGIQRSAFAEPREVIPIWDGAPPEAMGAEDADIPTLGLYPLDTDTPAPAVLVCPGGGYSGHAMDHEGEQIAQWLNKNGLAAFVLKYRLSPYRHPVPLNDAKRAMRLIRANATAWNMDPARLGIMGFSAGGHLASTVSTHFDSGNASARDAVERQSSRPDFAILCYPVITFEPPYAHMGSRNNLLGENAPEELVKNLSNHTQVTAQTPPTFLFHTADDPGVPVQNSLLYFGALREHDVPAELHVYEHGRHGVGLAPDMPELATWPGLCITWLRVRGIL
ncbi:MAG TPA: alpha/beta hydrolase [Candidatus Hydrogenedentes bacterium]|jgi:acetyl esterase/lipase|nr:alpha/beta hydrolase [FCB group bacterium]HNZ18646.1 alpha/beta hydrolase [Candidatus Hydrogenedentota bacterium]HOH34055.1 alpha/beta hydrolase [Candidatus Hydrogenedentota bacterium]HPA02992.1 alpha/beta hydrolase [Candidatus Hydrogenedentota bacterium]HPV39080.1 alpha/beta hydrolase [Candidatus Hydrogenedentota bacterium]